MPVVAKTGKYANDGTWRRTLRIVPYKGNRGYHYYLDGLKVNGKRKPLFFASEAEAKEELKKWDKRIREEGEDALAISQELRILAAKCAKRLEPFGKSIWDATDFYIDTWNECEARFRFPNNGLRHSFASYHLAKHQNAPELALEMGHSTPRMVFDNYREVVAPEETERYWTISPSTSA